MSFDRWSVLKKEEGTQEDLEARAGVASGLWGRARAGAEGGNMVGVMENGRELRT